MIESANANPFNHFRSPYPIFDQNSFPGGNRYVKKTIRNYRNHSGGCRSSGRFLCRTGTPAGLCGKSLCKVAAFGSTVWIYKLLSGERILSVICLHKMKHAKVLLLSMLGCFFGIKLHSGHIEYVVDCFKKTSKVRNIKKYLMAALFNAPTTISGYYQAEVDHDMPELAMRQKLCRLKKNDGIMEVTEN